MTKTKAQLEKELRTQKELLYVFLIVVAVLLFYMFFTCKNCYMDTPEQDWIEHWDCVDWEEFPYGDDTICVQKFLTKLEFIGQEWIP